MLVTNDEAHRLTLGRAVGTLDQALDLLACVQPRRSFDETRLQSILKDHLARLSSLIYVTLIADERRSSLCQWIERHGVATRLVEVTDRFAARSPKTAHRVVPAEDVSRGREIHL